MQEDSDSIQMHEIKEVEYIKQNIGKGSFGIDSSQWNALYQEKPS